MDGTVALIGLDLLLWAGLTNDLRTDFALLVCVSQVFAPK
jgi:hypothetical protein